MCHAGHAPLIIVVYLLASKWSFRVGDGSCALLSSVVMILRATRVRRAGGVPTKGSVRSISIPGLRNPVTPFHTELGTARNLQSTRFSCSKSRPFGRARPTKPAEGARWLNIRFATPEVPVPR
ncbi:hypothetical protein M419DRAFT_123493 [Trichoderma reesei RUT C-30]|uniref:Secreted protein n=1 Tax=Hypocrea jecorina (strain ATCC 56765 / BCRC 32924 / NRRL 11460 / Rut C-30) TaxID=1344414 RepID=A0A024S8P5_HYPJR|nr:hypothetical protein M419DRAFT_123493 [Trichoderma reesei RUT C-30]